MLRAAESFDYLDVQSGPGYNDTQLGALGWYQIAGDVNVDTFTRFGYGKSFRFVGSTNNNRASWLMLDQGAASVQLDHGFFGCAMYISEASENDRTFITLNNSANPSNVISVIFKPFGVIEVALGGVDSGGNPTGTVIWLSPGGMYRLNVWFYLEGRIIVDNDTMTPAGEFELRINTVPICDFINIQTATGGVTFFDTLSLGMKTIPDNPSKDVFWDDFYVTDTTGAHNTGFLGNTRVQGLLPNGPGDETDFSKFGAATNWQAASNTLVSDSKYVYSPTTNDFDLYEIAPLVNSPSVFGVQVKGAYRQDDATQRFSVNTIKSGATSADGVPVACMSSYSFQFDIWEEDPDTMMTWDYTAVNTLQIGPKVSS